MRNTKKITFLGLFAAVAIVLSFIEHSLPPFFPDYYGVKLGLANIVNIFILYKFTVKEAAGVTLIRILLVSIAFGKIMTYMFAQSLAGAFLSIGVMALLKKTKLFSIVTISIVGGICHNVAQVLVAIYIFSIKEIGYTFIPLCISGILSGTLIGIAGALILKYTKNLKGW